MAVTSVVKLSELEEARRIDAEFYHPVKVKSKKQLEKIDGKSIKDCFKNVRQIFDPKRHHLKEPALVFDLSDVRAFFIDNGKITLSSDDVGSTKKIFYQNDVLISRLRPYLKEISFVGFDKQMKLASTEFIILRQSGECPPEVLFSFLISDQVQNILLWSVTGTEHPRFNENYLLKLKIPQLPKEFQNEIKELVRDAWSEFLLSKALYSQAESLLLSELGLQNFKPKEKLCYTANLSECLMNHRIDAEYFNPSYDEIIGRIKNYKNGYGKLLTFVENIKPNFEPQKFPQKTFSYVELADINASIGVIQSSTNILGEEAPSRAKRILKKNDVIVSSIEGSLEKGALVDEQFEGSLASTGFFQFRPKNILPEVMLTLSKSLIIQAQLKKECAGTILTAVPKEALEKIIIPILSKQTQQKIAKLVHESHQARKKAKQLLEEAKKKVEDAIEKSK